MPGLWETSISTGQPEPQQQEQSNSEGNNGKLYDGGLDDVSYQDDFDAMEGANDGGYDDTGESGLFDDFDHGDLQAVEGGDDIGFGGGGDLDMDGGVESFDNDNGVSEGLTEVDKNSNDQKNVEAANTTTTTNTTMTMDDSRAAFATDKIQQQRQQREIHHKDYIGQPKDAAASRTVPPVKTTYKSSLKEAAAYPRQTEETAHGGLDVLSMVAAAKAGDELTHTMDSFVQENIQGNPTPSMTTKSDSKSTANINATKMVDTRKDDNSKKETVTNSTSRGKLVPFKDDRIIPEAPSNRSNELNKITSTKTTSDQEIGSVEQTFSVVPKTPPVDGATIQQQRQGQGGKHQSKTARDNHFLSSRDTNDLDSGLLGRRSHSSEGISSSNNNNNRGLGSLGKIKSTVTLGSSMFSTKEKTTNNKQTFRDSLTGHRRVSPAHPFVQQKQTLVRLSSNCGPVTPAAASMMPRASVPATNTGMKSPNNHNGRHVHFDSPGVEYAMTPRQGNNRTAVTPGPLTAHKMQQPPSVGFMSMGETETNERILPKPRTSTNQDAQCQQRSEQETFCDDGHKLELALRNLNDTHARSDAAVLDMQVHLASAYANILEDQGNLSIFLRDLGDAQAVMEDQITSYEQLLRAFPGLEEQEDDLEIVKFPNLDDIQKIAEKKVASPK